MTRSREVDEAERLLQEAIRARDVGMASRPRPANFLGLFDAVTRAQRALAAARGEEHAVPVELGFVPESAVPSPVLLQTELAAVLTFSAKRVRADGRYEDAGRAIIHIERCSLTKFGYPNDEALEGHPLATRGLTAYGIFEVIGSSWVKTKTEQNRVAFPNTPDSMQRHFIFTFHDSTFECIADTLRASLTIRTYQEVIGELCEQVYGRLQP